MTHQEQMLHAAYHHKSFRVFLNKAYEIIRDWYWFEHFEMVPVTIDVFKSENPETYSSVEKVCLSMVIDHFNSPLSKETLSKLEPKITKILLANHTPEPLPF